MTSNLYSIRYYTTEERETPAGRQLVNGEQKVASVLADSEEGAVAILRAELELPEGVRIEIISASQDRAGIIHRG